MDFIRVLVVLSVSAFVSSERNGVLQKDGSISHFDEILDERSNTSILVFETLPEPYLNTIAFHDYNKGYETFKEIKYGICLIAPLGIHHGQYLGPHLLPTPPDKNFRIAQTNLRYEDVIQVAGLHTADFCKGYTTRVLVETMDPINNQGKRRNDGTSDYAGVHCSWCNLNILGFQDFLRQLQ